jgi:hypothetical protein
MMKKRSLVTGLVFGMTVLSAAVSTAFARSRVGGGTVISNQLYGRIGMCWTDPTSSSSGSTSSSTESTDTTTSNYGVVLAIESGNGNEIAADLYSLDSNLRKVKQVGHADVTASQTSGAYTFSGATDSPSQFSLALTPQDYSSGQPREHGLMSAQLTNAGLFTGDVVSNIALVCDVADLNKLPAPNPSASPTTSPSSSPSTSPTVSPTSIPTGTPTTVPTPTVSPDPTVSASPIPSVAPSISD